MPLDASIFRRFAPKSVADYDREYAEGENAKQVNALNSLRIQGAQREQRTAEESAQRSNALRGLVGGFGADESANALSLLKGGYLPEAQAYQKANADRKKDLSEADHKAAQADKERLATGLQRFEIIGQIMGGVRDQASYDLARQQAAQQFGPEFAAKIPPQYDPSTVAQSQQQAMSVKERMEQEWKAKGYDRDLANDAEARRHNQAGEKNAAGQLAVSQGQLGLSRQRLALDASAPKGQIIETADGFMLANPRDGTAVPMTAGGAPLKGKTSEAGGSEGERTAAGFLHRMRSAEPLVNEFEAKGRPGYGTEMAAAVGGAMGRRLVTNSTEQKYRQAQEDWVRAKLRKESGAAIPNDEMDREIETYFPQPGEGEEVAAQKKQARKTAEEAMQISAGRATSKMPEASSGPKPGTVQGGYRFKGGDPAKQSNWEKV